MHYIIDKNKGYVTAQHDTEVLCKTHIRNAEYLFGTDPSKFIIVEGAKERDKILRQLKRGVKL